MDCEIDSQPKLYDSCSPGLIGLIGPHVLWQIHLPSPLWPTSHICHGMVLGAYNLDLESHHHLYGGKESPVIGWQHI